MPEELLIHAFVEIDSFIKKHDFNTLYTTYQFCDDSWARGFPNILKLEFELAKTVKRGYLKKEHIWAVGDWAKLQQPESDQYPDTITILTRGIPDIYEIIKRINFYGPNLSPTYVSTLIRFAFPTRAGAISPKILRVFGSGDSKLHDWLNLRVALIGSKWQIQEEQVDWPIAYIRWINILEVIANELNQGRVRCPHPTSFTELGLRSHGVWTCADVDMALFSYANSILKDYQSAD